MSGAVLFAAGRYRAVELETRTREGIEMGRRTQTLRVMVKPLGAATLDDYLDLVPRDLPDE